MAKVIKVKRLSNPRRRTRNVSIRKTVKRIKRQRAASASYIRSSVSSLRRAHKRSNPRRRKMSLKQIRIFGTKAQKAALKRRTRRATPRRAARRRKSNPALVVTLGAMNPRRRKKNPMAKTRRRARRPASHRRRRRVAVNPVRRRRRTRTASAPRRRRRRANPTRIVVVGGGRRRANYRRRRRANPSGRRRRTRRIRRNPAVFGHSITSKSGLKLIGGGVIGVTAAKFIPTMIPAQLTMGMGATSIGRVLITGVSAILAGWGASKLDPQFGEGVLFGGLMQTASVALNAFLPGFSIGGVPIGMGDLMPGQFVVPQNPIRAAIPPPAPPTNARVTMNGLARAYGTAF